MEPTQLALPGFEPAPPMQISLSRGIALGTLTPAMVAESFASEPVTFDVNHRTVSSQMRVSQESGERRKFKLTLFASPWPETGQTLSFNYGAFRFAGLIQRTDIHPRDASALMWECDVEGEVLTFDAPGMLLEGFGG